MESMKAQGSGRLNLRSARPHGGTTGPLYPASSLQLHQTLHAGIFDRSPQNVKKIASALDPFWYKDAIIYELHVRAFADSNNDGIGDFPGLMSRLDSLQG